MTELEALILPHPVWKETNVNRIKHLVNAREQFVLLSRLENGKFTRNINKILNKMYYFNIYDHSSVSEKSNETKFIPFPLLKIVVLSKLQKIRGSAD